MTSPQCAWASLAFIGVLSSLFGKRTSGAASIGGALVGCECVDRVGWRTLGGVALTGGLSLATAALNHRWGEQSRVRAAREQETRATRDQAREACHNYLVATNSFYQAVDQVYLRTSRAEQFDQHEHVKAAITALQDAYVYLTISSGAEVRKSPANTTSLFMSYKG
jgi:hypothetical protein